MKILNSPLPNNFDSGQGASKEISAIKSGDLLSINRGIRPAPIFDFTAQDDGSYWLWMRDLSDGVQPPWDGDQYIETARHVGQFNNLWTEQDRPKGDWITTDMSTDRRASVSQSTGHPSGQGSVGVDGGSLAGAGVTWVQSEANEIEEYESQIFAAYIEGLRDSGWCDDESEVRLTYLSRFVTYILFFPLITLVTNLPEHRRKEFFRRRPGVDGRTVVDQVS